MTSPYGVPDPPPGYVPPPREAEVIILACLPVDTYDLPAVAFGVRRRVPVPSDTRTVCDNERCKREVWIGENQRYCWATNLLRVRVLCYRCALAASDGEIFGLFKPRNSKENLN